jgi:GTP diphosphokinase / guanosine-3',5'-bis(diphosphate) 3'-diphosphatase
MQLRRRDEQLRDAGSSRAAAGSGLRSAQGLLADVGVQNLATLQAALLHDTLEDTETSFGELVEQFGSEVAQLVQEVTDDKTLPKEQRKALQVSHASAKSERAALIKTADKICNLQDLLRDPPQGWETARLRCYFDWAKRVVSALPCASQPLRESFDKTWAVGVQRYA